METANTKWNGFENCSSTFKSLIQVYVSNIAKEMNNIKEIEKELDVLRKEAEEKEYFRKMSMYLNSSYYDKDYENFRKVFESMLSKKQKIVTKRNIIDQAYNDVIRTTGIARWELDSLVKVIS